jgi:hypothetical protein
MHVALYDQLVKPPGGVLRDLSSNLWWGEFLVGGVEKNPSPVPRSQSTGKMDRPSHRVTDPCLRRGMGFGGFLGSDVTLS